MIVEEIGTENLEKYDALIGADMSENIGRLYYRGIGLTDSDGTPGASMIWELRHFDDEEKDTGSFIRQLHADKDQMISLLERYEKEVRENGVLRSEFELPPDPVFEACLRESGFNVKQTEGSQITPTLSEFVQNPVIKKTKVPDYIKDLTGLDARSLKRGILSCIFRGKREVTEDLNSLPFEWFEKEVSCYTETDGRIDGLLLVHRTAGGCLKPELLINVGPESGKDLKYMLCFSANRAREIYSEDTKILIRRNDEDTRKLTDYFFPEEKGKKAIYGSREEKL